MKKSIILTHYLTSLFLAVILLFSSMGHAGGDVSGGGNRYGLAAASALKLVAHELKERGSDLINSEQLARFEKLANSESTVILMVEEAPRSIVAGVTQRDTAYSATGNKIQLITIHEQSWKDMKGDRIEEVAFMAHEAAVLLELERTGVYGPISAELRNRLLKSGLSTDAPKVPKTIVLEHPQIENNAEWWYLSGDTDADGACKYLGYGSAVAKETAGIGTSSYVPIATIDRSGTIIRAKLQKRGSHIFSLICRAL